MPRYSLGLRRDVKEKNDVEVRTVLLYAVALVCCRPNMLLRQVILPQKSQKNMNFEQALAKMSLNSSSSKRGIYLESIWNDTFPLYRHVVDKDYWAVEYCGAAGQLETSCPNMCRCSFLLGYVAICISVIKRGNKASLGSVFLTLLGCFSQVLCSSWIKHNWCKRQVAWFAGISVSEKKVVFSINAVQKPLLNLFLLCSTVLL